jgi:hypothetical protein
MQGIAESLQAIDELRAENKVFKNWWTMTLRSSQKPSSIAFLEHRAAPTIVLVGTFILVMLVKTPHIFL